jgi:hypothetical protein
VLNTAKNGIDTMKIKCITNNNVLVSLVSNTTTFITRDIRPKVMGLEVDDDISIP